MENRATANGIPDGVPTSEVGLDPSHPTNANEQFRYILESQNRQFLELIKALQAPKPTPHMERVTLPKFNSDASGADAVSWCATVDVIMADNPLEGSALIIALSKSLEGCASQWLSQIGFSGITWPQFKELFIQRFEGVETSAATLMNILNGIPNGNECLSVYASRLVTSLMSKWKTMTVEEIAVSVVLAHTARFDSGLQRLLFKTNIKTRNELQQELRAFAFTRKRQFTPDDHSEVKRSRLSANIKCHFCGKTGHKIVECRLRKHKPGLPLRGSQTSSSSTDRGRSPLICFKCGEVGHIASRCPGSGSKLTGTSKSNSYEKRVDACEVMEPKGVLVQSGESYQFCFDSGAECSLVKETIAANFSGKKINNVIVLRGIGETSVFSYLQILSNVKICQYSFEILFHVVTDKYLKHDVMIGREILSHGFGVVITSDKFDIFREKTANVCSNDSFTIDTDTELIENEKVRLMSLLGKYANFFIEGIPRTRVTTGQLDIRLVDPTRTVQRRPYRLSSEEKEVVRSRIGELLKYNIIRPSCSPFASPMLLVKKKNGSDRLCVDYRELNSNTISDKYPLPLISDQIARLRGANYFSCLDMASGFHQIPIHPYSIERTAFVTPEGQYEFLTMPFGLKNAPSVFQRAVMKALGELAYSYVIVYMDDIMIISSTKEEGFYRLENVLDILTKAGFSFNVTKCSFLRTSVEYLGYEIKAGVIRPNPRKIQALTALPPPQSVHQLRQFLGLASYFRQFVAKFSQIMKPLYLLISNKNFVWKPEHEQIRGKIIHILTNKPVLTIFDPQYPIELHTDASADGYGAILLHKIDNKPHVIEYYSKRTSSAESKYHSYELETLAVVNSIKHFRHYLQGRQFVVFTDCNSFKASRTKIDLTPRAHRWWAYLQSFDFIVEYREGKRMAHVDFFSRNLPLESQSVAKVPGKRVNLAEISDNWLVAEQQRDPEVALIVRKLHNNELGRDEANTYELRAGVLYRKIQRNGKTKCLPVVPRSFRWSVINHVHESIMHLGSEKTLDKVYDYYWFDNMSKYVRKFVDNCITCKLSKSPSGKIQAELHPIPKVNIPWHTVHIDITGKLSGKNDLKEYIIVQIDAFTKYVYLHHTLNIDAKNCIESLKSSISLFGVPFRVVADQGRCFACKEFKDFCSSQKIDLHLIATGASRANGQVERVMSTLKNLLTAVETSHRSWQDALGEIQLALNSTTNRVTKASPLELLIGKEARPFGLIPITTEESIVDVSSLRAQAIGNIRKNACYDKERFDKTKAKVVRYKVGDYVLLKNEERHQTKLDPKFKGPFLVAEVLEGDRYILKSLSSKRSYKYSHEHLRKLPEGQVPNELNMSGSEEEMEIDVNENSEDVERDVNESTEGVEKDVNENMSDVDVTEM